MPKNNLLAQSRVGERFRNVVITSVETVDRITWYACQCDCSQTFRSNYQALQKRSRPGCDYPDCWLRDRTKTGLAESRIGEKFGRLTTVAILRTISPDFSTYRYDFLCRCDCGVEKYITWGALKSGKTKSCGCLVKEQAVAKAQQNNALHALNPMWLKNRWYFTQGGQKVLCRSSYEVFYANWLLTNEVDFQYEGKRLVTRSGHYYTPDFWLGGNNFVELKGRVPPARQAQKIKELSKTVRIQVLYWEDIVRECRLKYSQQTTYRDHAKRHATPIEDYLGKRMYL